MYLHVLRCQVWWVGVDAFRWRGTELLRSPFAFIFPLFSMLDRWDNVKRVFTVFFFFLPDPGNPDLSAQDTDASGAATSNIPLTDEERLLLAYEPEDSDWLGEGRDAMTERLIAGLEALSQLNFAGPFVYPVDVQAYPDYWTVVPYPTDLSNLREKLLNKYYR